MRSLTVQVDDRPARGRQKPPRRSSSLRPKMRWPGVLRSRAIRRAVLAGVGLLALALAAYAGMSFAELVTWMVENAKCDP